VAIENKEAEEDMTAAERPQDKEIDNLLLEERRFPPPPGFAAEANAQPEIYDEDFEAFWEREGRERVTWFEPFTKLLEWEQPYAKWFLGGRLNISYNCVDRHVERGLGDKVAFFWEGEAEGERRAITYSELLREVVKCANALKALGVAAVDVRLFRRTAADTIDTMRRFRDGVLAKC